MTIKNRYALSTTGDVVDIQDLDAEQQHADAPFWCVGCETELAPQLSDSGSSHFAHKDEQACPTETYLHRLAKRVFVEAYTDALVNQKPFHLRRHMDVRCNAYEQHFGFTCRKRVAEYYDLTRYFDRVAMEQTLGDVRADVLLSSSGHPEVILVEFAVTHRCELEKIASGYRIIELTVQTEHDIEIIRRSTTISASARHIKLHNFVDKPAVRPVCEGDCEKRINVFLVYPSTESVMEEVHPRDLLEGEVGLGAHHREILGPVSYQVPLMELYKQKVREAHFAGVAIRNCFLCTYHGGDGSENDIFCKLHRQSCSSNQAAICKEYRPLPSLDACEEADTANKEYVRKRHGSGVARRRFGD
jgi:hypothetical protein